MGIIIRQSIKTTLVTYVGILIGYLNTLWLMPYFLEADQIGMLRLLTDLAFFLVFFAQLGVPLITVKFFPQHQGSQQRASGFLFFLLVAPLVGFGIFGAFFFLATDWLMQFFEENAAGFLPYTKFVLPLALLMMYLGVFEAFARIKLRIVVPGVVRQVLLRILIGAAILVYAYMSLGFSSLLSMYVLIHGIALLVLMTYVLMLGDFKFSPEKSFFEKPQLVPMLTYGAFIIIGGLGSLIVNRIDIFMVSSLVGLSNTGIYSIALFVATVIEIPKRTIGQIAGPIISQALKDDDFNTISSIYRKSSLNQFLMGSLIFILIWANIDNIFALIPNAAVYQAGKYVVLFLGLSKVITMLAGVNDQILINSKYYKYNFLFIVILGGLAILTNLWLIPIYGINGAAIATALSVTLFNVMRMVFILAKFNLQPFSRGTMMVLFVGGITYGLNLIVPAFSNTLLDLVLRLSLLSACFGGLSFWLRISPDLNDMALKLFRKI